MSVFSLISGDGDVLQLDATVDFSKSRSNRVTESSVMSGATVGDGISVGNYTLSISGICTYNKISRRGDTEVLPPNPLELDQLLEDMVLSQKRFTIYGNDLIQTVQDVVITNHNVLQDKYADSVTVSLGIKQVFVSNAARQATFTIPSVEAADEIPKEEEKGAGTKVETVNWLETYRSPTFGYFAGAS